MPHMRHWKVIITKRKIRSIESRSSIGDTMKSVSVFLGNAADRQCSVHHEPELHISFYLNTITSPLNIKPDIASIVDERVYDKP